MNNVTYKNVENEFIKDCFEKALAGYHVLKDQNIQLNQIPLKGSTMRAQPILSFQQLFTVQTQYQIDLAYFVKDSKSLKVSELPEDVLVGWFAHELGHIEDYQPYSTTGMIAYGIKYLLSERFKKFCEHAADRFAMQAGYKQEILATKKFIFSNDLVGENYKQIMRKYYMSIEDVNLWDHQHTHGFPSAK